MKSNDFLSFTLSTIESEETILFEKIDHREKSQHDVDLTVGRVESNIYLIDMFIHFLISLNKKFILPKDNLVLNEILLNKDASHKTLSEYLIKILNLESKFKRFQNLKKKSNKKISDSIRKFYLEDPLDEYRIDHLGIGAGASSNMDAVYLNSVLKFLSDMFSTNETTGTTGIFYSTDFLVLIDIIIRKLANLSAVDQVITIITN